MRTRHKIFMLGLLVALLSRGMLWAEQRPREGEVRGLFLRLAEREVDGQGYLAIVIRPTESDEPVTLLLPRRREEIGAFARQLRPEQKVEVAYVVEGGQKWVRRIETEHRPGPDERRRNAEQIEKMHARIAELREAAEYAEREGQYDKADELREEARRVAEEIEAHVRKAKGRRPAEAEGLERPMIRRFEHRERPERWREGVPHREFQRRIRREPLEDIRERHEPRVPGVHLERMQKELHDVLAEHLERMANAFRELQIHVERLERQLQELRAENTRLKRQLHERHWLKSERETDVHRRREQEETQERWKD
ncbi:MAG: hypothetical protein ACE5NM_09835 [Sedimentisphaerales bacterium]